MNKTISINLGGIAFNIDDEAYKLLDEYLKAIEIQFSDVDERNEIIKDVEFRLAELFKEKISLSKEVITLGDVDDVIIILGKPEDFNPEMDENNEQNKQTNYRYTSKRMYRDPDNRLLGGVCGGMGAYLNIDSVLFRVLFVIIAILGFGTGLIIYLVLWIAIPEAGTTAQKLEMRGEPVTIENIRKSVQNEFEKVKNNINKNKK
ncbi:MAG: PspC domain-containing protein [Bacteroidota bacterium]|nr:PspC domain-containing protein [Bacteroidota bacterium]